MAEGEEEVHYASGVFKAGNNPPPAAKRAEETVYVEVKVQNETKNEAKRGEETVYDEVKVQNETKNEAKRGEETVYGEVKVQKETKNEAKRGEETVYDNVKVQNETKNEDSAGHRRFQHLACCLGILCVILLGIIIGLCVYRNNAELYSRIQELETNWKEHNVSRAQWSIDSYCGQPGKTNCQACQKGWQHTESSCYEYNNPKPRNQKTWQEAQEDCSGKNSNLAFEHDSEEKETINENSFGYWIGLRVVNKKWEWVDGIDLTDSSWIAAPVEGHCAVFYNGRDIWSSVSCDKRKQWICQKKALSV
ncbi:natural killer cells antigen CD94-like isoform X6 [Trematomus bernacchii]|uniref:natural killer cells antigen CD94-like isoform X6 n=1 Tax=Trematomus bernacchii TaxID=40690 RepID=UPI00146D8611|nr:natural killer cells antigen CD94-like isoform X6 [Trematomus bernacchii]